MAAEPGTPPMGAGGSGGAQILQQIEGLLAQLAQSEPEPEIQQAVQGIAKQVEALQPILGKDDTQDMQGGLANPGAGGGEGMGGGGIPPPGGPEAGIPSPGGEEPPPESGPGAGGGDHHGVAEIHIKMAPGGPKSFGAAKKAAMATHKERGHFDKNTPKGETPSSPRTKAKAKG